MNAAAGLLTTLVNVMATHSGVCSIMAIMTFVVTSLTFVVCLVLFIWYRFLKLKRIMDEDMEVSSAQGSESLRCSNMESPDPTSQPPPYSYVSFHRKPLFDQ